MNDFQIIIGGEAGEGSKKAGLIIAKILSSYGYQIYIYEDYQSLIKGGHNFSKIRASRKKISSSLKKIDFLLALDKKTLSKHQKDLKKKGLVVFNSNKIDSKKGIGVEIEKITDDLGGIPIMKNSALISAFCKIVGIDWLSLSKVLKKELTIETELNLKIAQEAYDRTEKIFKIRKGKASNESLVSGNEAIAEGAISAGLDAYVAYPMTPATGILNHLAMQAKKKKLIVFQPENEISVVNMAMGLSFSGKKTMTGTSGGGFCLMNEGISLAAQAEIPLVIVEGQRMGPSTGVPTYGGQSDLMHVLHSGHGDLFRFVVAPGDAEEAFQLSGLALNVAWKYQTPAIIISDKDLLESTYSMKKLSNSKTEALLWNGKGEYSRYKNKKDGISPLAFPGDKGATVKVTSYEHDEFGIATEDQKEIKDMQEKRLKKEESLKRYLGKISCFKTYGKKRSKVAVIAWGSTKNSVIEACQGLNIKVIQPIIVQPFMEKEMQAKLKGVDKIISIENNSTGQMAKLLRSHGIKIDKKILKYDGRPFDVDELKDKLMKIRWIN